MELTAEHLKKEELKSSDKKLFGMLPIYQDKTLSRYIVLSYEEEYYLDDTMIEVINGLKESEYDFSVNGESLGTIYYFGYNI